MKKFLIILGILAATATVGWLGLQKLKDLAEGLEDRD